MDRLATGRARALVGPLLLLCAGLGLGDACKPSSGTTDDAGLETRLDAAPAGLYGNCTPVEAPCEAGLRCALLRVGEAPYQGQVTQCVPYAPEGLALEERCAVDAELPRPEGGERRFTDRCGPGLACVETTQRGPRCRPLCALRVGDSCAEGLLCVVPTAVSSVGTCEAPDGCRAAPPQQGCPARLGGVEAGCYALSDKRGGGTYCLPRRALGGSDGGLGAPCERAVDCGAGLGCATIGQVAQCRPYCELPVADGGTGDLGVIRCGADLGVCQPLGAPGIEQVGRCL